MSHQEHDIRTVLGDQPTDAAIPDGLPLEFQKGWTMMALEIQELRHELAEARGDVEHHDRYNGTLSDMTKRSLRNVSRRG